MCPKRDERLVSVLVIMPDELSLQLHNLELVIVHLSDHFSAITARYTSKIANSRVDQMRCALSWPVSLHFATLGPKRD
jgi:hypothetical protein